MIAIYVRVSTDDQSQASQMLELEAYAQRKREAGEVVQFFPDKASGKTIERPAYKRMQKAIEAGSVTEVVCWRLDRLARSLRHASALFEDLQTRGIRLVSIREGIDFGTISGKLLAGILASFAEFERAVIVDRVKAGIAATKAAGNPFGGSKPGRRKVKPEQLKAIERLKAEGETVSSIARTTGLTRKTVYSVLNSVAA